MRKLIIVVLSLMVMLVYFSVSAEESIIVYVNISEGGNLVVPCEAVKVRDVDGDGVFSIDDTLYCAHEQFYPEGASGYLSVRTEWGLSMMRLWGVANGGSYGYYVDHASSWSMADPVRDGGTVSAYTYKDTDGFSDTYSYFDVEATEYEVGEKIELTLSKLSFDQNFNTVSLPVDSAEVLINGERSGYFTDENGKVTLILDKPGHYYLSASGNGEILVPTACRITVKEANVPAADPSIFVVPALAVGFSLITRKRYEA